MTKHDVTIVGMNDEHLSYFTVCSCGWKQTTSAARGLVGAGHDADQHLREQAIAAYSAMAKNTDATAPNTPGAIMAKAQQDVWQSDIDWIKSQLAEAK